MTPRESIAAGAALGAAKDLGLDQTQQATAAILAARQIKDADAKKSAAAAPTRLPADSLDLPPKAAQAIKDPMAEPERPHRHHKPANPRQEGFLLKLAHFLNLK